MVNAKIHVEQRNLYTEEHRRYYRGADKSLARPGWIQATATEDFDIHISYLLS